MNNEYVNKSDSAYDPIEQDYNTIRDALAAKPAILQKILKSSLQDSHSDATEALTHGATLKPDIHQRLEQAEKRYQTTLNKQADAIFALYQKLPVDRKIYLLVYAEEIGEINDKARKLAAKEMQEDRAEAINAHRAAIAKQNIQQDSEFNNRPRPVQEQSKAADSNVTPATAAKPQPADETDNKPHIQPPEEKGLVNQIGLGSPAALTVNFPFTVIPGLPALSKILEKIDRTTHFDLGFTIKGVADREPNPNGGKDILYRLSYLGGGIMSSKFNVQISPIAIKLEESRDNDKWGGSASLFTRQHSDGLGSKATLNFNDSDAGLSYAHEYSYQTPSNKFISTLTGGRHFSNDAPAIRILAAYVPTIERILDALPSKEEADIIFNRIDKVIPVNQAVEITSAAIEAIDTLAHKEPPAIVAAKFAMHQELAESGLSTIEQARVFAKICQNCEAASKQGVIPDVQIMEKSANLQTEHARQAQP